ncbi:MAG: Gfo/Idh/MocA family oxidoreductase [Alphaproteobacteria bacterium]
MTFRLGWIGCGRQASEMLLPELVRIEGVGLAALADIDEAALARIAERYGVVQTFADYRDLLARDDLDGVGMAVGPAMHREIGLAALARGLPVFMEKPPAADLAGTHELAAAAARAKKPLLVGFMKRFSSGNKLGRNVLRHDFGQPLGFYGSYMTAPTYFAGEADYRGFFLHHCVHYFDLAPWLMGSPIADLSARQIEPGPGKLLIHLALTFESGALGTLVMGTIQSRGAPVEFIQIMGDHRKIEIENVTSIRYTRDPAFKVGDADASLEDGADTVSWTPNMTVAANEDHKGYRALLQACLDAMRGKPSDAPTIEDAVRAMAALERMADALGRPLT